MSRVRSGKRPLASRSARPPTATANPPPSATARPHFEAKEKQDDDEDGTDWAAEFEDVEKSEAEQQQQQQQRQQPVTSSGSSQRQQRSSAKDSWQHSSDSSVQSRRALSGSDEATTARPSPLHFDYHFLLPLSPSMVAQPASYPPSSDVEPTNSYIRSMRAAFTTALSDRVRRLHVQSGVSLSNATSGSRRQQPQPLHMILSLATSHPSSSPFRPIDLGPEASSVAAANWRSYWADRSELRRFADGRVLECVVWRAESDDEKNEEATMGEASVLLRVVRWVMKRKGRMTDTSNIRFVGWQAAQLLRRRQLLSVSPLLLSPTPELVSAPSHTASLHSSFSALSSLFKSLPLPLSFTSLTAVHPSFRYSDPFPPLPLSAAGLRASPALPVIDVVAQFESSSAWPSSMYAIQQIKTAFVIQLSAALQASASPLLASTTVSYSHLDVLTAEPAAYCFRIHLLHHGELQPLSLLLHQSLRAFALLSGEGGVWGGLVCLAKRWVQCHMWADMLGDYVVELLCAAWWKAAGRGGDAREEGEARSEEVHNRRAVSGGHAAVSGVSNPLVLLIGWLDWLGAYDFASGPLVVLLPSTAAVGPASSSASSLFDRALAAYNSRQREASSSQPMPALYIATAVDLTSRITSPQLSSSLLSRLQLTAASCASHLSGLLSRCELRGWMSAFKPDRSSFDVLLHLRADQLGWPTLQTSVARLGERQDEGEAAAAEQEGTEEKDGATAAVGPGKRRRKAVKAYKRPLDERKEADEEGLARLHEPLLGVDVQLEYVRALQQHLGVYVDVHADLYGGTIIGVRWKRRQEGTARWTVKDSGYSQWQVGSGREGERNVEELLADMELIGQAIVDKVELQKERHSTIQTEPVGRADG